MWECIRGWWPRCAGVIPFGVIVLAVSIDLVTPRAATGAPLLTAAPVTAASLLRPRWIVAVGLCAMLVHAGLAYVDGTFRPPAGITSQVTIAAVTGLAVLINRAMRLQNRKVQRAQYVAALAQQAVLPTPPPRVQGVQIASRYVPAEDEALIGGDLYAVQETPYGLRAFVGDVRGKGLGAVESVSLNLAAFRLAADEAPDLPELARQLETSLAREGARRAGVDTEEGFTTALLVEIPHSGPGLRILNRGHPTPLLLSEAGARLLAPSAESLPLGLGAAFGEPDAPVDTFPFPEGATLLCFTDGVTEARDATGAFYTPEERLPSLLLRADGSHASPPADRLLETLARDVLRHTGGVVTDDQALLALRRPPVSRRGR